MRGLLWAAIAVGLMTLTPSGSWAKGLGELKAETAPAPDKNAPAAPGAETKTPEVKAPDKADVEKAADKAKDAEKDKADKADKDEEAEAKEEKPAPVEPSAVSKAIAGKMYAATSFGLSRLSGGSKGDWKSGGGIADFSVGYKIPVELLPKLNTYGTFRYAPMDTVVRADKKDYRGAVETYHFGGLGKYAVREKLSALGSVELGYNVVHADIVSNAATDDSLAADGVNFTLGGGAEWAFYENFAADAKLALGFGQFSTFQFAAGTTFGF